MLEVIRKELDTRFEAHYTRHEKDADLHQATHDRDTDRRNGYLRWAVTTIMTGVGVLVAIYAALGRG
jgi:hypothetical protein